jgi:hypothetical protein
MKIPLHLGPLKADGYKIHCSGVRWLCEPGQMCRANQVVAYFNLSLEPAGPRPKGTAPFADERELQVACAPRMPGRLIFDSASAPGGYLSVIGFNPWNADVVLAHLETDDAAAVSNTEAGRLRLLLLAGRRMTPLVDVHSGLLPGWNGRSRGWWCENSEKPVTLLSLGICDITGVILGEQCAFLEMFASELAPTQFVFIPDHPIAPSAPVLLDQLERTPAQFRAISTDLLAGLSRPGTSPTPDDLVFAGTMLSVMQQCPIRETHDLLSETGLTKSQTADAILLSLSVEPPTILQHKTLGYRLHLLAHHQTAAGPAVRHWLATAFAPVARSTDDIRSDYEKLIDAIDKSTCARVIILNRMSTSGDENISSYAPFDSPLSGTLANIASKELNLMLHDLAASRNVAIIDVDAIAAEIGGANHLPDGIHQSKALQDVLRGEILRVLDDLRPRTGAPVKPLQTRPA